jgi:hypothetical protein
MSEKMWVLGRVEVIASGFFTTHHDFHTEAGLVARLTMPAFRDEGILRSTAGHELHMYKPRWLGTARELVEGETVRGLADRPGLFSRDIAVTFDGQEFLLERPRLFSRDWQLVDRQGNVLLTIQPRGIFRQGAHLDVPRPIELSLVAFSYYLARAREQEEAAGAAAAS